MSAPEWRRNLPELERLFGLQLSPEKVEQLALYLTLLLKWGRQINLTADDDPARLLRFHFFESFWMAQQILSQDDELVDVGSGAGFPGLAALIHQPRAQAILIEPNYKRVVFLQQVIRESGLKAVCFQGKMEEFAGWRSHQWVTIRALEPPGQLIHQVIQNRLRLAVLHGQQTTSRLGLLKELDRKRVPGSDNRFLTLFVAQD